MPFRWQINASSVSKLIGAFKLRNDSELKRAEYRREALARTWANNLKRMPRFGVAPSTTIQKELAKRNKSRTTSDQVEQALKTSTQMNQAVQKAVSGDVDQMVAVKAIETSAKAAVEEANKKVEKSAQDTARAAENVIKQRVKIQKTHEMRKYNTIKSGVKKTRARGWFFILER